MEILQVKMIAFTKITNIIAIFILAIALVLPVKA